MPQKHTLLYKNFARVHCFKRILKNVLPHDTLSHDFLINCNNLSHNFNQNRRPCHIIFTVKGYPMLSGTSRQAKYGSNPPPGGVYSQSQMTRMQTIAFFYPVTHYFAESTYKSNTQLRTSFCLKPFRNHHATVF